MLDKAPKRTRIAPTPSGFLHIGNIISFTITRALANILGAKIHLRIDDLDQSRCRMEYLNDIFETLNFLGIQWDEGPRSAKDFLTNYSQNKYLHLYSAALQVLREKNLLYACICSRTRSTSGDHSKVCHCQEMKISLDKSNIQWRLSNKPDQDIIRNEIMQATPILVEKQSAIYSNSLQNLQVKKKDNMPSYHLSSLIDDLRLEIDLIVRGDDLLDATNAQLYLSTLLPQNQFIQNLFYHHRLIKDEKGLKLSKSAGATSIHYLRKQGLNKSVIFSLIAQTAGLSKEIQDLEALSSALIAQIKPGINYI